MLGEDGFEYQLSDGDFFGEALLSYVATDGEFNTGPIAVTINVLPVNDPPQVLANDDEFVNIGAVSAPGFASMDAGPDNESNQQALTYTVSNLSEPSLFSSPPAIAPDGTLSFTAVEGATGQVTFDVVVQDDGGTTNGGDDTSEALTVTITLTPVVSEGPTVIDFIIAGSTWSPEFIDAVDGGGAGGGNGLGYSLVGSHQTETLPWNGFDTLYLIFSDDVSDSLTSDDVLLTGTNGGDYTLGDVSYGIAGPNVAKVSITDLASGGITTDSLVLSIRDGAVQDVDGNPLNGDWVTGQSGPSG